MADDEHRPALFGDDMLLYISPRTCSVAVLMEKLVEYGSLSGYKLNVEKTQVITFNYNPPPSLIGKYDLKWDSGSIRYLGIVLPKEIPNKSDLDYTPLNNTIKT